MKARSVLFVAVLLLPCFAWAQGGGEGGPCDEPPPIPPVGSLPEGFGVNVFADGIPSATAICWDNRGRAFVGQASFSGVPVPSQNVFVLEDMNGDGDALDPDEKRIFAGPFGAILGVAVRPRAPLGRLVSALEREKTNVANLLRTGGLKEFPVDIYVNHVLDPSFTDPNPDPFTGVLTRLRDLNDDGDALDPGEREDIVTGMPTGGDHNNDNIAIGPDGNVYFGMGIRTNWGGVDKPDGTLRFNDPDDCPGPVSETFLNGTIVSVRPDGTDLRVIARGARNPFGIGFLPNGVLLWTDNGPDVRNCYPQTCVPDELNVIVPTGRGKRASLDDIEAFGKHFDEVPWYGAPDFGGTPPAGSGSIGPIHNFPPSISADGFDVNLTDTWCGFEGNLFIAEFGNFGNFPVFSQGMRLERLELITEEEGKRGKEGIPTGVIRHDFGGQFQAFGTPLSGHPVDAKFGPDDALYVTLFAEAFFSGPGKVIRIFPLDSDGDGTPDICEE